MGRRRHNRPGGLPHPDRVPRRGKTTRLKRILEGDRGLRVAALLHDFGEVNIDAEIIKSVGAGEVRLANGCDCCSIREDLIDSVLSVLDRRERPDDVVFEVSGVAEPTGIAYTFTLWLRDRLRLDSVTCVLDAEQFFEVPELMELKMWQVAFADLLILNKVDLVGRPAGATRPRTARRSDEHLSAPRGRALRRPARGTIDAASLKAVFDACIP